MFSSNMELTYEHSEVALARPVIPTRICQYDMSVPDVSQQHGHLLTSTLWLGWRLAGAQAPLCAPASVYPRSPSPFVAFAVWAVVIGIVGA